MGSINVNKMQLKLLLTVFVFALLFACSGNQTVRELKCPVVACKAINCKTPTDGEPYYSDEWKCVQAGRSI